METGHLPVGTLLRDWFEKEEGTRLGPLQDLGNPYIFQETDSSVGLPRSGTPHQTTSRWGRRPVEVAPLGTPALEFLRWGRNSDPPPGQASPRHYHLARRSKAPR